MKFFHKLEEYVGGILFLVIFVILLAQIFVRQVFNSPFVWSTELSLLLFVNVALLGVSMAVRSQQHVYIDFLTNLLPASIKPFIYSFTQLVIFFSIFLLFYLGLHCFLSEASILNDELVSLHIHKKWLYLGLPVISVLIWIRFLQAQQDNFCHKLSLLPPVFFLLLTLILLAILFWYSEGFQVLRLSRSLHLGRNAVYVVLLVWLSIMFLGTPVGWALFISTILYFSMTRWNIVYVASSKLTDSLNSFPLLSVPFFILTGILMNTGGITARIFDFAKTLLGHYRGGMGHVNIGASLIFSGMSGSALADAGGLGQLEMKAMRDAGYDDEISGGLTAASCIIGPLVPPSIAMIIYGVIANVSIAKLFVAGFIPGILLTIALMVMNAIIAKKRHYPCTDKFTFRQRYVAFKKASYALFTPILIIGGIFSGLFTPTEAAVVAASYAIFIGMFVYKELTFASLFQSVVEAIAITGVTALMVMAVTFFGDMIAREQVARRVATWFMSIADTKLMVLVMINILLIFLGMFIDALALQFLVLPMLIPIATHFGIDLVFFGVMTTLNMMLGILTPPMGMALFVVARVGNMPVSTVTKGVLPFLIPILACLVLITLFPASVTFIPHLLLA